MEDHHYKGPPTVLVKSAQSNGEKVMEGKKTDLRSHVYTDSFIKVVEDEEPLRRGSKGSGVSGYSGGRHSSTKSGGGGGGGSTSSRSGRRRRSSRTSLEDVIMAGGGHLDDDLHYEEEEITGKGCCSLLECVDRWLKRSFFKLGVTIGKNPTYFIVIPIFVSLLLGTGMQRLKYVDDPEYLFSPVDGDAKAERTLIDTFFPMNYSSKFNPSRFVRPGRFARLFVVAKDGGTLLRSHVWKEINKLDEIMHKVKIIHDEDEYRYDDLCARWESDCYENEALELGEIMDEIEAGNISLTYPIMLNPNSFKSYAFPFIFGGAAISNVSTIKSVKAMQLNYFINVNSPKLELRGEKWERAVLDALEAVEEHWQHITVARFTVRTLAEELERNTFSVIPYFSVTVFMMIVFTVTTCMMWDWVKSKPWLGVVGVISSTLGSLAAFGLVVYCGVDFIGINMAAPFLMLGIGIDDTFVMLASWRRTTVHESVPKRMGECYAEAAVSITITSITDMLSFWVGVITPFPCVKIFSIYSGAAVVATYLWHLCFFGGAIALSGYHEQDNRHSVLWCYKSTPKSKNSGKSFWYKLWCTGGIDYEDPYNPKDNKDHGIMVFFRDYWGAFLNNGVVKICILALFIAYLGVACWGITKTQEGLERRKLARYDSYAVTFFDTEDKYFREFPYRIQVVLTGDVEYSNEATQRRIESIMQEFERSQYIDSSSLYTENWLRAFLGFVNRSKEVDIFYNITTETDFIETLQDSYLGPSSIFSEDIKFNENNTRIIAARFVIQTVNIMNSNEERDMAQALRKIAKEQAPQFNVTVFHPFFVFFDQFLLIRATSIQCVTIAAIIMMGVSLVFIPNPLCSLWVAFSILSIEIGVVGFMTLWNVNLDAISMINLIMCIGFSVDFSAHISYAYMSAKVDTPEERVRSCLYSLGLPIVQGAISTILGVIALLVAPSYIFITFFKVVFLVIFIAAMHGLFLLPVLLSLFGPGSYKAICGGDEGPDDSDRRNGKAKDKPVPYSFVVSPAGLDPKAYPRSGLGGPMDGRRTANVGVNGGFAASFGLQNGQFVNAGVIPRVQVTKAKSASPPSRSSIERDVGLGTSGEDDSSESSLTKKNNNKNGRPKRPADVKEMYQNEGYLTDDEGGGQRRKSRESSNNNSSNSNSVNKKQESSRIRSTSLPHSSSPNGTVDDGRGERKNSHRGFYVSEMRFP